MRKFLRRVLLILLAAQVLAPGARTQTAVSPAAVRPEQMHTDPLNLDPLVREAYGHFYNLDYDGSLSRFEQVLKAHPDDPMANAYVLMVTIFRELYHQDLLDTTYYAHDSFLTSQRRVEIPDATRRRIEDLTNRINSLVDARLKSDGQDKNALFARGYARGLHAAFITLADHSYVTAARQGLSARNDSEAVLKIDPQYADANMAIGIQQFAVASLPRFLRMLVGIAGVGGNKERGLALLRISAEKGTATNVESRTTLSLFLRHDGRYAEALSVQHGLAQQFRMTTFFAWKKQTWRRIKVTGRQPSRSTNRCWRMRASRDILSIRVCTWRGSGLRIQSAARTILPRPQGTIWKPPDQPNCSDWIRKRAELNAGEMFDLMHDHANAVAHYQRAAASGGDQTQADAARKYMKNAYSGK